MNETKRMARFIVETRLEDIPEPVITAAKTAILDTVGVTLAAISEPVGEVVTQYIRDMGPAPHATVLGARLQTLAPWAALANGALAHALDFDDSNWELGGHASVGVLPAVLAQAEIQGASGREVLEAFIIGFETSSKLGSGMNPALRRNGWHPTCVLGAMGATASVARLLGLDLEQTRNALGCAASHASGICANFGTMLKPLHAGLAAEAGVRSAGLAAAGITANRRILEGSAGFCESFCGEGNFRLGDIVERLGQPFCLERPGDNLKPYPCCMSAHTSVDALRDLIAEADLSADDVDRIEVGLTEPSAVNLSYHRPQKGLEGKFSAEYCLARILIDGALHLASFTDPAVNEPAVQDMMGKIHIHIDKEIAYSHGTNRPAVVTVHTHDGRKLTKRRDLSRGNADCPMTQEEILDKFRDCAGRYLNPPKLEEAVQRLSHLEGEANIRSLISLLA